MKKLVNIHKLILFALIFFKSIEVQAQVWTLQKCIDTAQVHNKNLQIGRHNIAIGEQKTKETKLKWVS